MGLMGSQMNYLKTNLKRNIYIFIYKLKYYIRKHIWQYN
jgi:hypothetical protein